MLPALDQFQNIWPENQQKLAEFLTQSEGRRQLQTEMELFSAAYEQNRTLLRFPLHPPAPLLKRLQELELPRNVYSSDLLEAAAPSFGSKLIQRSNLCEFRIDALVETICLTEIFLCRHMPYTSR